MSSNQYPFSLPFSVLFILLMLQCNLTQQQVRCVEDQEVFLASTAEECSNQNDTLSRTQYTLCYDSTYIYDGAFSKCPKEECQASHQQCWDGNCVSNLDLCSPIPRCPPLHQRCSNGQCVFGTSCPSPLTCNGTKIVCLDGAGNAGCYDSPVCPFPYYGCPVNGGFLCPSGECVSNISTCQKYCPTGYYFCWDQMCYLDPLGCSVPGFILSYPNFTEVINNTEIDNIISVRATNQRDDIFNQPLFSIKFFAGTFSKKTSISFHTSPESEIRSLIPPKNWVDNQNLSAYYLNIYSAVVKFWLDPSAFSDQQNILFSFRGALPLKSTTQSSDLCLGIIQQNTWTCVSDVSFAVAQNELGRVFILNGTLPSTQVRSLNWAAIIRKNTFLPPVREYETLGGGLFFGFYILISIILVVLLAHRKQSK